MAQPTYEYLIEDFPTDVEVVTKRLNELGADGWVLNSFIVVASTSYRAIFMRETPPGPSPATLAVATEEE